MRVSPLILPPHTHVQAPPPPQADPDGDQADQALKNGPFLAPARRSRKFAIRLFREFAMKKSLSIPAAARIIGGGERSRAYGFTAATA